MKTRPCNNRQQKAMQLMNAGVSVLEVAKVCAHSSARTTERIYGKCLRRTMTVTNKRVRLWKRSNY